MAGRDVGDRTTCRDGGASRGRDGLHRLAVVQKARVRKRKPASAPQLRLCSASHRC